MSSHYWLMAHCPPYKFHHQPLLLQHSISVTLLRFKEGRAIFHQCQHILFYNIASQKYWVSMPAINEPVGDLYFHLDFTLITLEKKSGCGNMSQYYHTSSSPLHGASQVSTRNSMAEPTNLATSAKAESTLLVNQKTSCTINLPFMLVVLLLKSAIVRTTIVFVFMTPQIKWIFSHAINGLYFYIVIVTFEAWS